jgi:cytochrome c oxidase assembly protein subunit 15
MKTHSTEDRKWIIAWLFIGVVMVFFQIMLGGITRLTGSGLSITRWEIVTGTIPPLNAMEWQEAFDLYKETPQYRQINEGMSLSHFKFIFFWEYIHRLWARTMGFVFLFPFLFFLWRRSLRKETLRRLLVVVMLAAVAALFGWIMVASGLINRPWVNAYKLTVHLCLGISLFIFLWYTWVMERGLSSFPFSKGWSLFIRILIGLTILQVCFGGFVSGMKSALNYPTWPLMQNECIPAIVFDVSHWNTDNFLLYDKSGFMSALVQAVHRNLAYLIAILVVIFSYTWLKRQDRKLGWIAYSLVGIIVVQIGLGILTLLGSKGSIPVLYGVLHQGVGIIFLTTLFYIYLRGKTINI